MERMTNKQLTIIHTSDWHLGQVFHSHDRSTEHQRFLEWLVNELTDRQPDALLIAGDIFDHANPSGEAQRLFYRFLSDARWACPEMDIAIIGGNHDSAGRLEAPAPLLKGMNIRIIGQVNDQNAPEHGLIPLHRVDGSVGAWCLGVPFLRAGDLPRVEGDGDSYPRGIGETYRRHVEAALAKREPDQALIAMGHLHARGGATSEDSERRLVVGGQESVDASIFPEDLAYVALGHLHLAQNVGGQDRIRYSGSPLPLSFSEINYPHQVLQVRFQGYALEQIETIPVPRPVHMLRVPEKPASLAQALEQLQALTLHDVEPGFEPWLEVQVVLDRPEPGLRQAVEEALQDKPVRLVKITPSRQRAEVDATDNEQPDTLSLDLQKPDELFIRRHQEQYGDDPSNVLKTLFNQVQQKVSTEDTQ